MLFEELVKVCEEDCDEFCEYFVFGEFDCDFVEFCCCDLSGF